MTTATMNREINLQARLSQAPHVGHAGYIEYIEDLLLEVDADSKALRLPPNSAAIRKLAAIREINEAALRDFLEQFKRWETKRA